MTSLLQHDEHLLPSPPPSQPVSPPPTTGLFFSGPDNATAVPETPSDPETGAPIVGQLSDPGSPASGSGDGWSADESSSTDAPTSSDTSSGSANPLTRAAARETARAAVLTAGLMAHRVAAKTEGQMAAGLLLTDDEDAAAIGNPLGNLAHRQAGKLGTAVSADTADLLQAMFGVANYFGKQVTALHTARRIDLGHSPTHRPQEPDAVPEGF